MKHKNRKMWLRSTNCKHKK